MERSRILVFGVLLVLIVSGLVLLRRVTQGEKKQKEVVLWPNADFAVKGKVAFKWSFPDQERYRYVFRGRALGPGAGQDVYDPETWSLRVLGEGESATLEFHDGPILIFHGRMTPDGVIRVRSYQDYAEEPTEFWQILLNFLYLTPRQELAKGEERKEEFELPSRDKHRVHGVAVFRGEGQGSLQEGGREYMKIRVRSEVRVDLGNTGDKMTEYAAEGTLYWDAAAGRVAAGEFEYGLGLPRERYFANWHYASFTVEGAPFPPVESDLSSLGVNTTWTWVEDITREEMMTRSFQKAARDKLANIAEVQEDFRSLVLVDQDEDGKGEYGLLSEVGGKAGSQLRSARGRSPWPSPRPQLRLQESYARVGPEGFSVVDNYCYQVFLRGPRGLVTDAANPPEGDRAAADLQEVAQGWCGYAWPLEYGTHGRAVYFSNGVNDLWESLDVRLSGAQSPARPKDTGLPSSGTWRRVSKIDPLPPVRFKLLVVRGALEPQDEVELFLGEIQTLRITVDDLALNKALDDDQFRRLEAINRGFLRARADGSLTVPEAREAREGYATILRDILLAHTEFALRKAQRLLEDGRSPALSGEVEAGMKQVETLRSSPDLPSVHTLRTLNQEANRILERASKLRD